MTQRKYKCSINPQLINKNDRNNAKALAEGFEPEEPTAAQLMDVVFHGLAISFQFEGAYRKTQNFICTDIAMVDVDGGRRIEVALADPLVANNALFIYTTTRHTSDKHRYRIVFGLSRTIIDNTEIRALSTGLAIKFAGDLRAVDAARISYGSSDCKIYPIGKELGIDLMTDLIHQGLENINNPKQSSFSGGSIASARSQRFIDPKSLIKTAHGEAVVIGSIKKNTSIFCPDHFDSHPSAFVSVSSTSGGTFMRCQVCMITRWIGTPKTTYDFNSFDTAVKAIHSKGNVESVLMDTPLGEMTSNVLKGGRIHLSSDEMLQIKKLQQGVMFIKSPKGSGKTTILPEIMAPLISVLSNGTFPLSIFEENDEEDVHPINLSGETGFSVLLIGHRRSLIREMSNRLSLNCYLDDDSTEEGYQFNQRQRLLDRQKRYGICLDSLPKLLRHQYDLIIIDESEQVLSHFMSETMAGKREHIFRRLGVLLRDCNTIICLDADLSWLTFNTICELAPARSKDLSESIKKNKKTNKNQLFSNSKPVHIYLNEFELTNKSIDLFQSKAHLVEDMMQSLTEGKRLFITSNSKGQVEELDEAIKANYPNKTTRLITSANSSTRETQNFIQNIKVELLNYDAILTSPSLSTGVDITFEHKAQKVDVVYGIFENKITQHFEIDQQIARVRHPKEIKIWISPQCLSYETDIATVKYDILNANLLANTYSQINPVTFEETIVGDEQFLRLASIVASRGRASMNRLRGNFVKYKESQGFKVKFIETDTEQSKAGLLILKSAKESVQKQYIDAIINAPYIDQTRFLTILESRDSNLEVSPELRYAYVKSLIEFFFRQPINEADIVLYNNGYRDKIHLFEALKGLDLFSTPMTNKEKLDQLNIALIIKKIKDKSNRIDSIPDRLTKLVLLHLLLSQTPIYKDGHFITDRIFSTDDLGKFVKFIHVHKAAIECQLCPVRMDFHNKPVKQLSVLLGLIGLITQKAGTDQKDDKKKYLYRIDPVMLKCAIVIVEQRQVHSDKIYSTLYWEQVHKANNFETPIYEKLVEYVGNTNYPLSYWMPMGGMPFNPELQKSRKAFNRIRRG